MNSKKKQYPKSSYVGRNRFNNLINTKVSWNNQFTKKQPIPQYFKWCSCHQYKSNKQILNDNTCYRMCELH